MSIHTDMPFIKKKKMVMPVAGICNPSFLYYKDLQSATYNY